VSGATLILLRRFSASQFWEHVQHYDATQFNFIGGDGPYALQPAAHAL